MLRRHLSVLGFSRTSLLCHFPWRTRCVATCGRFPPSKACKSACSWLCLIHVAMAPSARKPQPSLPIMQRFIPCQARALGALFTKNGADAIQVMLQPKRPPTRASFASALWPALTQRATPAASCLLVPSQALCMQLVLLPSHSRVAEGARLFSPSLLAL